MSTVDYHAWTHRPKWMGGTDPDVSSYSSYARAKRVWPADDAWELVDPEVMTPIPFTTMVTNNPAVFEKDTTMGQLADSAIGVKLPGLYIGECKVEYIHDGNAYFQTLLTITDLSSSGEIFPISSGQHGANVGVLTGEGGTFPSTVWGYDTRSCIWLEEPGASAMFYISTNLFEGDGGVGDPSYVNQAWLWVMHVPLGSLAETDIF